MTSPKRNSLVFSAIAASAAMVLFACSGVSSDLLDAQPSGATGSSGDSGASGDARVTRGDGGKTTDGGIVKPDSGGGHGDVVPAVCGASLTCNSTDPKCCGIQGDGLTTTTSYSCTASDGECTAMSTAAVPIECRDNSDCNGGTPICCGILRNVSAQGGYASVSCQSSCPEKDTGGNLTTNVIFCSNNDPCTADGFTCGPSTILPGFNVCGND